MTTHFVLPLQLISRKITKTQWKTLAEQNPKRWKRTPVISIAHLTSEDTLKSYLNGDFSQSKSKWNKRSESVLAEYVRSFDSKIDAYRYAEDLVEEFRNQHWRVYYNNPRNRRIYIIRLKEDVWKKNGAFAKANGGEKQDWRGFLYVGETDESVEKRYQIHTIKVDGKKHKFASKYPHNHHLEIAFDLMEDLENTLYCKADALEKERDVALKLRSEGYATWYN
tara:strand:+ start:65 stop:733 length:669 start_codon:yes stop_codon:yes gene_type:complete